MKRPTARVASLWLSAAGTAVALALAIWPWLLDASAAYNPAIALTCLTAIALIWYTRFTWQTLDQARQKAGDDENWRIEGIQRRQLAVDAQISAIAYALRRNIRAMLDHPAREDAKMAEWAAAVTAGFAVSETRMLELMALAPNASAETASALREAYVTYYAGTHRISQFLLQSRPGPAGDLLDFVQRIEDVKADLQECLTALERVISPELMEAEEAVEARREAQDPIKALGKALAEESQPRAAIRGPEDGQ